MTETEILKSLIFYGFAGLTLTSAVLSIFNKRILYSLLFAVILFFSVAGLFFTLGADYNAVIQIATYGIAIPILFVFAIMFTSEKLDKQIYLTSQPRFLTVFTSLCILFLVIVYSLVIALSLEQNSDWIFTKQTMFINKYQMFTALAKGLYVDYVFAFELFSLLLLIAVVGLTTMNIIKEKKRG